MNDRTFAETGTEAGAGTGTDEERALLRARTQALARPLAEPDQRPTLDALEIQVSGERYAIEAHVALGVAATHRIAPLPHAPPHVAGLVAHGAEILPAFHLHAVLDMPLAALPEHGRVVLLGHAVPELALVVESITGVRAVDVSTLAPVPESFSPRACALMRGLDASGVPLVNGAALLDSELLFVDISPFRLGEPGAAAEGATGGER